MNINFLDKQRESNLNKNNVVKLKQQEIESLQEEIVAKENKLNYMNNRYFEIVLNKDKLKVHTQLKEDLVSLKARLQAAREELSLFEQSYRFEYGPEQIASELTEQAEKAKLQKRIENIEAKLQEARKEAEELAADLFEYNNLITNTINTYTSNVSESNADVTVIEKAKEPIYKFHDSPVAHLVKTYPTNYYFKKECIFK